MSEVFELRQYTLHPGRRDTLIELFEREFLAPQEACGMTIPAIFRDLGDPDRFVWFRGFADMERRREALTCFYEGPVWKANRDAANATMIDSDDVLLLRLVDPQVGFPASDGTASPFHLTVYSFDTPITAERIAQVRPLLQTETAENNYPRLPVRTGEHVLVTLTREEPPELALQCRVQHMTLEPTSKSKLR